MFTIMGATGNTGREIAEQLLAAGEQVRVLGRSAAKLTSLGDRGAEVMTGDATDAAYLTAAFRGADAVYTLLPEDFQAPDYHVQQEGIGSAIVAAIRASGVQHVVYLSCIGADLSSGTGLVASLHAQEERLKSLTGTNVLALRAVWFFENNFGSLGLIKQQGINGGSLAADVSIPMIATRDIAEAAAGALRERDFSGFVVREVLGQRDLTMNEVTRILGALIDKPGLAYVHFSDDDMKGALVSTGGFSPEMAGQFVEMTRAFNEGTIRSQEGRRPDNTTSTRFEDFAEVLAGAYRAA